MLVCTHLLASGRPPHLAPETGPLQLWLSTKPMLLAPNMSKVVYSNPSYSLPTDICLSCAFDRSERFSGEHSPTPLQCHLQAWSDVVILR